MIGLWTVVVVVVFATALWQQERFPYTMGQFTLFAIAGYVVAGMLDALIGTL